MATADETIRKIASHDSQQMLKHYSHVKDGRRAWWSGSDCGLYCAAYGTGFFIVRGFGPAPFQMNGREGEPNDAVHKAPAVGKPVTQEIALSVKGNRVECSIKGTVVAGYDKVALIVPGKLKSTDGVYGLRFAHNTEVNVTGTG